MSTQLNRRPENLTGIPQWRGLAIGVEERGGTFVYRVRMVHDDPVNGTVLVQTEDEKEAVIAWRYWSATLHLPRLIEKAPNEFHEMEWRCGALVVRSRTPRRRGSPLFSRRPRRMRSRAVGRSGATSIYRDEREIIARN